MRRNRTVYATRYDFRGDFLDNEYLFNRDKVSTAPRGATNTKDVGVQYNYRRDNVVCTCGHISQKRRHEEIGYFSGHARQIYVYHGSKSHTNIGVGTIKAHYRKKVRKIHLGETGETDNKGVGSSDLSSYLGRRTTYKYGEYHHKKRTSTKCVGGAMDATIVATNEKLSPVVRTVMGNINTKTMESKNVEIRLDTHDKILQTISAQTDSTSYFRVNDKVVKEPIQTNVDRQIVATKYTEKGISARTELNENCLNKSLEAEKVFSSDSLIQQVHNLEDPCEDKKSALSVDIMENKLEREYRKIFCVDSNTAVENTPLEEKVDIDDNNIDMMRRFQALRQDIAKKDETKRNTTLYIKDSSHISRPSRRDVSIVSDPPSLEARSYSSTRLYTPQSKSCRKDISEDQIVKPHKETAEPPTVNVSDGNDQGVKDMFRLWGKMFNLEDTEGDNLHNVVQDISKIPTQNTTKNTVHRKEGNIFRFFKKKSNDKSAKLTYKPKKGVTAGRCEVGDGLKIKIRTKENNKTTRNNNIKKNPTVNDEMIRKAWLQQFLARTIESRKSVKIRWNNKAYATSSSTIFEMMENVYKNTGVVFKSHSDITTEESSYYKFNTKHRVNFNKNVEAWMLPIFILDKDISEYDNRRRNEQDSIEVTISDQKWFIDKSKAYAQKIVLHSKDVKDLNRSSSEYLTIEIPKGFFSDSSSDKNNQDYTSNEEVFKIVEYLTPENPYLLETPKNKETGDNSGQTLKVSSKHSQHLEPKIIETLIKKISNHRKTLYDDSSEYTQKKCDVIGISILTQKDVNRLRKPILKIRDEYSNDVSNTIIHHIESKFAEEYMKEYYEQCEPLAPELCWCVSDSHLQCCLECSDSNKLPKGNGCKSCPTVYDGHQASVITSCGNLYCNTCSPWEDEKTGFVSIMPKFRSKEKSEPQVLTAEKRVSPKDSHEVYRKRKIYALSNKSKWLTLIDSPCSISNVKSEGSLDTLIDCSKTKDVCCKPIRKERKKEKKINKKHVSLPDCETMSDSLVKQLDTSSPSGILTFKKSSKCDVCNKQDISMSKCIEVINNPTCPVSPPNNSCITMPKKDIALKDTQVSPKHTCGVSPSKNLCHKSTSPIQEISPPNFLPPPCIPPWVQTQPYTPKYKCVSTSPSAQENKILNTPPNTPYHGQNFRPEFPIPSMLDGPGARTLSSTTQTSRRKCNKKKKKRNCWSPGRPPCGSPMQSGISLRSPPKSKSSTPLASPSKSLESCASSTASSLSVKASTCQEKSPICNSLPLKERKQHKKHSPRCIPSVPCASGAQKKKPLRKYLPCSESPPRKLVEKQQKIAKSKSKSSSTCVYCRSKQSTQTSPVQSIKDFISCLKKQYQSIKSPKCPKCHKRKTPCCVKSSFLSDSPRNPDDSQKEEPTSSSEIPKSPCCQSPCSNRSSSKSNECIPACDACKTVCSQEFPWPLKNQHSNQPSLCSICPETVSHQDLKPNVCQNKTVQCPSKACIVPTKISGIFLKMKPASKTSDTECPDPLRKPVPTVNQCKRNSSSTTGKDVARDVDKSNMCPIKRDSFDDITINIKKGTVSTEEIREGLNFKVQDYDGKTLYERRDYFANPVSNNQNRQSILNDMYKNSHCHTVSTTRIVNKETGVKESEEVVTESRSHDSVANLIEINLKFKVTHGDKTSNVNVGHCNEIEKPMYASQNIIGQTSNVFVMKDKSEQCTEDKGDNNDINLKITIKNFKSKNENKQSSDNFTNRISQKFHTVSTVYSNRSIGHYADKVLSVQRANVNIFSTRDQHELNNNFTRINGNIATKLLEKHQPESEILIKADLTRKVKDSESYQYYNLDANNAKAINHNPIIITDSQVINPDATHDIVVDPLFNTSVDLITEALNKDEKKPTEEEDTNKIKHKEKIKQFKEMLHVIFTDSSGHEEMKVSNKDYVKETTCTSLNANYLETTERVKNCCKSVNSTALLVKEDVKAIAHSDLNYMSEDLSQISDSSENTNSETEAHHCLCNTFAKRLNICSAGGVCCCKKSQKSDKEITCNFGEEDLMMLNSKKTVEYVNVETQKSRNVNNTDFLNLDGKFTHGKNRNGKITLIRDKNIRKDKECPACVTRRILGVSDEDKLHFLRANQTESCLKSFWKEVDIKQLIEINECKIFRTCTRPSDILQSYETKKAVLGLYTRKIITSDGECIVARLPKFVSN